MFKGIFIIFGLTLAQILKFFVNNLIQFINKNKLNMNWYYYGIFGCYREILTEREYLAKNYFIFSFNPNYILMFIKCSKASH